MLKNRIFAEGSVDAVLQDEAILIDTSNVEELYKPPIIEKYNFEKLGDERPLLKHFSEQILRKSKDKLDFLYNLAQFTSSMANIFPIKHQPNYKFYPFPDDYFWGGTEEMLITKGTDWCGEVARVFCALAQMAKIPTRIVYTSSDNDGHVINESYLNDRWILVDSTNGIIYKSENAFINASDFLLNKSTAESILKLYTDYYYSNIEFFKYIGISEYVLSDSSRYDYKISFCNEYYRDALKNSWNN